MLTTMRAVPLAGALAIASPVVAGDCFENTGPDLMGASVGNSSGFIRWGNVDGMNAFSFSTNVCNIGSEIVPVTALTNQHPVFTVNTYRLLDGRFEQIGIGWVKHMFGAATSSFCCPCTDPGELEILGVGCADAYGASQNGGQAGHNGITGLGPRSDINPVTGAYPFPYTTQGLSGGTLYKRLQIHDDDLDPALNEGARYFAEEHYLGPADSAGGNPYNNMCYRPLLIGGPLDGSWNIDFEGASRSGRPPLEAWVEFQPTVTLEIIDVPGDGRLMLGYDCTDNGDGTWHYEYALYNLNSHRSAASFSVPVGDGAAISNVGFRDIDYHSGEPYDGTDWPGLAAAGSVEWATDDFESNANANALRWGTVYNFRLDADTPPVPGTITVGLFRPGVPDTMTVGACVPSGAGVIGDATGDGAVDVDDLVEVITSWGPCPGCPADFDGSGAVDVDDLVTVITSWTA